MTIRLKFVLVLITLGAGWGATLPLIKVAVSGDHHPLGLVFWQLAVGAVLLTVINGLRGTPLPMTRKTFGLFVFVAITGTLLPNLFSFTAAAELPAGVMAIIISSIPMIAFPIALALGTDEFSLLRLLGLALGLTGVALIALPEASLPDRAMVAFLPIALVAPLCYAIEENVIGKWGTLGLDGMQTLQGASIIGALIAGPIALSLGVMPDPRGSWGTPEWAFLASAIIHVLVYSGFMWLIVAAGAVFAAQVSTFVTAFGVMWSVIFLGEGYSGYVWSALVLMLLGLSLVKPRDAEA